MAKLIETRPPSGFRDYTPAMMVPRERVLQAAREVYRSYGFTPIDTPAAESLDVLLGKGGEESDKRIYYLRHAESTKEEMGLRFDLTVPFARFAARNINELGTPFKRYAMGPVWRGERPAHGRFREFWQCDFDTIGTTSNAADIEVALVVCDLFARLEIPGFALRINNRLVLNGLLEQLGIADKANLVLRALDKFDKIGREKVAAEMAGVAGLSVPQADRVLSIATAAGTNEAILAALDEACAGSAKAAEGLAKLRELLAAAACAGIPDGRIRIDPSIARGLDYYTGTIYETTLTDLPGIGSVCSGGRYDNLASLYTNTPLPGVGASLGVDRLLAAMGELAHPWLAGAATSAPVLILQLDASRVGDYQRMGRALREAGVGAEVYPDPKKLGVQFQYAEKRGFRLAVIAGSDDFAKGVVQVKHLARREQQEVADADLAMAARLLLGMPAP